MKRASCSLPAAGLRLLCRTSQLADGERPVSLAERQKAPQDVEG